MSDKKIFGLFSSRTPETPDFSNGDTIISEHKIFDHQTPEREAVIPQAGLTLETQQKIDSIIEGNTGDTLRYFFMELITKSTPYLASFKENSYNYALEIHARFQKPLSEIILLSLGDTQTVSYEEGKIKLGEVSFDMKQWHQDRISIDFDKKSSFDAEQLLLLKNYFATFIFPLLQESHEKLTFEDLYSILEIQEKEKLLYEPGKINIIFPLEGEYKFDYNADILPFVSTINSMSREYMFSFSPYVGNLKVHKNSNEISLSFSPIKQALQIEITAMGVSTLSRDLMQNFVKNLLKHLRALNSQKDISQIKGLVDAGALVHLPQHHQEYELETYFEKYGFVGYEDVKQAISREIIKPWKNKDQYLQKAQEFFPNIKDIIPNTVLFEGVPGTGKTTYAKIIGEYLGYPFVYIPIGKLMSKWYGESETRLSMILEMCGKLAKETFGVVIMIDEIDEIGGNRDKAYEATARITGVLLKKLDGLEKLENILMICSTNRKESLDSALLSRFKLQQNFRLPNASEIQDILKHYIGIDQISQDQVSHCVGYSGRQLKGLGEKFAKYCIEKSVETGQQIDKETAWEEFCEERVRE